MRSPHLKRIFDIAVSALLLAALLPVALLVALAVRLGLGRPVIFRQVRPGLREQPFVLFKFRTMLDAVDTHGQPLADAMRLTRLGKFLRMTSLDEIPQLWNVLRGEMSLVGPRPLLMEYLPRYSPQQRRRHLVRPGITGLAQVNGRNALDWEARFALDVQYVEQWSLPLDGWILWKTLAGLFRPRGVCQEGQATMSKFEGTRQSTAA